MLAIGVALVVVGFVLELTGIALLWRSSRQEIEAQDAYDTRGQVVELGAAIEGRSAIPSPAIDGGEPPPVEEQIADLRKLVADHLGTWKGEMRKQINEQVSEASQRLQRHHKRDIEHIELVLRARRPSKWPLGLFALGLIMQVAGGLLLAL